MFPSLVCWAVLSLAALVSASPLQSSVIERRQSILTLTTAQVSAFKPYTSYAGAAYCRPPTTKAWTCGPCKANPDFQPLASGGDGADVQFWYVGYDPSLDTVIVGHQGTDPSRIIPVLTDLRFYLTDLDRNLFPGLSSAIQVHSGFKESQADTAAEILPLVKSAMSNHTTNSVTVVGHSLGGAIALLDGVYLDLQIPTASVSVITYGMPRVGNQAFADYVDAHLNVSHVNNKLPEGTQCLFFQAEPYTITIPPAKSTSPTPTFGLPAQDNENEQCTVGEVRNVLVSNVDDHSGPYDGVMIGTAGC